MEHVETKDKDDSAIQDIFTRGATYSKKRTAESKKIKLRIILR
jgi:hypothetical protein